MLREWPNNVFYINLQGCIWQMNVFFSLERKQPLEKKKHGPGLSPARSQAGEEGGSGRGLRPDYQAQKPYEYKRFSDLAKRVQKRHVLPMKLKYIFISIMEFHYVFIVKTNTFGTYFYPRSINTCFTNVNEVQFHLNYGIPVCFHW